MQPPIDQDFHKPLQLDHISKGYLETTARWGRFLAIAGFVVMGISALFILGISLSLSFLDETTLDTYAVFGTGLISVITALLVFGLGFFPLLYLYRFSTQIQEALRLQDGFLLQSAFDNMRLMFKFLAILTVLSLGMQGFELIGLFAI